MKVIVAGLHPQQSRAVERMFPQHDIRTLGNRDKDARYQASATGCDLCVVNTKMVSHNKLAILRSMRARMAYVGGLAAAIAAIEQMEGSHAAAA